MAQVKEIAKQQNKRLLDKQQDNHKSQHIGKTNNKNNEKKKGNGWSNLFNHMPKVPKLPFKAKLPEDASFDVFLGIMSKEGEEDKAEGEEYAPKEQPDAESMKDNYNPKGNDMKLKNIKSI